MPRTRIKVYISYNKCKKNTRKIAINSFSTLYQFVSGNVNVSGRRTIVNETHKMSLKFTIFYYLSVWVVYVSCFYNSTYYNSQTDFVWHQLILGTWHVNIG